MFGEKKKKEEPRFVETMVPSKGGCFTRILVDTENGIQYLFVDSSEGGGTHGDGGRGRKAPDQRGVQTQNRISMQRATAGRRLLFYGGESIDSGTDTEIL